MTVATWTGAEGGVIWLLVLLAILLLVLAVELWLEQR